MLSRETCNRQRVLRGKYTPGRLLLLGLITASLSVTSACNRNDSISDLRVQVSDSHTEVSNLDARQDLATTTPCSTMESTEEVPQDGLLLFESQELEQLSSPFTKETVLELNAIVSRSLAAIEAFDAARRKPIDGAALDVYEKLLSEAGRARADMSASDKRLRDSGEKYNQAILAAMVRFVDEVDAEIRESIRSLPTESPAQQGRDT